MAAHADTLRCSIPKVIRAAAGGHTWNIATVGVPLAVNAPSACQDDAATTGVAGGGAVPDCAPGGATMAAAAARRSALRLKAAARWTVSWNDRKAGHVRCRG